LTRALKTWSHQPVAVSQFAFSSQAKKQHKRRKVAYPCVPEWQRTVPRDPFDYQLRTAAEVREQHKYYPPDFHIKIGYKRYTAGDVRLNDEQNMDNRERVAKIVIDMREMNMATLQRERLIFLLGPRFNPKKPFQFKIVAK